MPPAASPQQQQALLNALHSAIPTIYANGFGIATSASDLSVVLMLNNNPVALLSLSLISAKTLSADLARAVEAFQKATKLEVKTIQEITQELKNALGEANVKTF